MKKTIFLLLGLAMQVGLYAQTADEIIAKHVEATGGAKWKDVNTVYMEGVSVMPNGNEITSKTYKIRDKVFRREIEFGMGSVTTIVTPKQGWFSNPRSGGAFENMPDEMYQVLKSELDVTNALVDYAGKGNKVELVGKEQLNGRDAFHLKATLQSGREVNYYIDAETYYLVRQSFKGGMGRNRPNADPNAVVNVDYSDFRKTPEGIVFAYAVTGGGMQGTMNFEKIEVNTALDEAKLLKTSN